MVVDTNICDTHVLSDKSKMLYINLLSLSIQSNRDFYPSIIWIAKKLNKSERTLQREMAELKRYGLIRIYRDRKLKSNNNYIIIPLDWVDFVHTYDDSYTYIDTLEEFEKVKADIRAFYESECESDVRDVDVVVKTVKKKVKREVKPLEVKLKLLEDKIIKNPNYSYNGYDCCLIFNKYLKKYRPTLDISVSNAFNNTIMKTVFGELDRDDVEFVLETFIKDYEKINPDAIKYPVPEIKQFSYDWLRNKIFTYCLKLKESQNAVVDRKERQKNLILGDVIY